jgi:hypothetical protein
MNLHKKIVKNLKLTLTWNLENRASTW